MTTLLGFALAIGALTMSACTTTHPSPGRARDAAPPPAITAAAPATIAEPPLAPNQITARRPALMLVDVAEGRPASAQLPKGSIYVGTVLAPDEPTLFEWDVAGAKVLRRVRLPSDVSASLAPVVVRVASARGRVYAVLDGTVDAPKKLIVLDSDLATIATRDLPEGRDVSIEANDRWVAVAVALDRPERPLDITLFDAKDLAAVASTRVGANAVMSGAVRADALELHGGRLYVAGRPLTEGEPPRSPETGAIRAATTVFSLELPSLAEKARFEADHPAQLHSSLTSDGHHVVLVTAEKQTMLTRDLRVARERMIEPEEGRSESCTAARSGAGRLYVCGDERGHFVKTAQERAATERSQ
jgi:hypothetical protein